MYSPRLYKYRDSYVLYKLKVHTFGTVSFTHALFWYRHTHMTFSPPAIKIISIIVCSSLTDKRYTTEAIGPIFNVEPHMILGKV